MDMIEVVEVVIDQVSGGEVDKVVKLKFDCNTITWLRIFLAMQV